MPDACFFVLVLFNMWIATLVFYTRNCFSWHALSSLKSFSNSLEETLYNLFGYAHKLGIMNKEKYLTLRKYIATKCSIVFKQLFQLPLHFKQFRKYVTWIISLEQNNWKPLPFSSILLALLLITSDCKTKFYLNKTR